MRPTKAYQFIKTIGKVRKKNNEKVSNLTKVEINLIQ